MTILLTGGTGYIASHTASLLAAAGERVVLLDNLRNSRRAVVQRLESLTGQPMVFCEADVRDEAAVTDILRTHACTAVIHFAGLKAVGESVEQPLEYFDNNVNGSLALLRAMQATDVHKLVFSSSCTVYGSPAYLPVDEDHPLSPVNPYGRSKLHVEQMLAHLCASDPRWRVACLRYFNPVGAHPSGLIGEEPVGTPNNLMPYLARVALGELPVMRVFGNDYATPDGTGVRDYVHVMDVAQAHVAALPFLESAPGWHVMNIGTGHGHSVLEVIRAFEQASSRKVPYEICPRRPGDVAATYCSPEKAQQALGWRANLQLSDMCESMWKWCTTGAAAN
jgi:UDP-glucose 4-epimerase